MNDALFDKREHFPTRPDVCQQKDPERFAALVSDFLLERA
jgi:hypothetical protein